MIQALVERLPAMVCPRWVDTLTQPIAIDDVLGYLVAALDLPPGQDGMFEIGGTEVVSYGGVMRAYAEARGLRRPAGGVHRWRCHDAMPARGAVLLLRMVPHHVIDSTARRTWNDSSNGN